MIFVTDSRSQATRCLPVDTNENGLVDCGDKSGERISRGREFVSQYISCRGCARAQGAC